MYSYYLEITEMPVVWRSMFNAETMIQVHDTSTCMLYVDLDVDLQPPTCIVQSDQCGKTLMVGWVENKHTLRDLRRCT
jgi:hypothetical protein